MVKVALLIGVSQYEPGLTALPSAVRNVAAMQRALQNPETAGFAQVKVLSNPTPMSMQKAIEMTFSDLAEDDLGLLYFSGHGLKDEDGRVYFATRYTRKDATGGLLRATAFPANFIQDILNKSRCQQQVIVLDCSFSRAYSETATVKTDDFVDVAAQLGGKRRGILTASTSTLDALEPEGEELSVYTRYLAEAIETGTADADSDGAIILDELHDYARQKVQETSPAIQPKLFAEPTAAKIIVAQALINDPKFRYRQQVERFAHRGKISNDGRHALDALRSELDLAPEQTAVIEAEVLNPYQKYQKKLERYGQVFLETVRRENPVSASARLELKLVQKSLQLRNEDVEKVEGFIERKFFPDGSPHHSAPAPSSKPSAPPPPPSFLSAHASSPDADSQQIAPSELSASPFVPEFSQVPDPALADTPFDDLTDELGLPDQSDILPEFDDATDTSISSELPSEDLSIFDDLPELSDSDIPSLDLGDSVDLSSPSTSTDDDFDIFDNLAEVSDTDIPSLDLGDAVDLSSPPAPNVDELGVLGDLSDLSETNISSLDLEDGAEPPTPAEPITDDFDVFKDFAELSDSDLPSLDLGDAREASSSPETADIDLNVFDDFDDAPNDVDLPSGELGLGDIAAISSSSDPADNDFNIFEDFGEPNDSDPPAADLGDTAELPSTPESIGNDFDVFGDFAESSDTDLPSLDLVDAAEPPNVSDPPAEDFDIFDDFEEPPDTDLPSVDHASESTDTDTPSLDQDNPVDLSNPFTPISDDGSNHPSESTAADIPSLGQDSAVDLSNPFAPLSDDVAADHPSEPTDADIPSLELEEPASGLIPPAPLTADLNNLPELPDSDLDFVALDLDEEGETSLAPSEPQSDHPFDPADPLAGLPDADLLSMDLSEEGDAADSAVSPEEESAGALAGLPDSDLLSLNLDEDSTASDSADRLIDEFDDIGKLPESEPISFERDDEGMVNPSFVDELVDELEAPSRPGLISSELNSSAIADPNLPNQPSSDHLSDEASADESADEFPVSPDTDLPLPDLNVDASSDQSSSGMGVKWIVPAALALCAFVAVVLGFRLLGTRPQTPTPTASEPSESTPDTATSPAQPVAADTPPTAASPPSAALYRQALGQGSKAATLAQSAQSQEDWQTVADEWGKAIEFLKNTPSDDSNVSEKAQEKIAEYQQYQAIAQQQAERASWRQAVSTAEQAAQQAGTARTSDDWNQVATSWSDAIALLQSIPADNPNYDTAQAKIGEYQRYRDIAKFRARN